MNPASQETLFLLEGNVCRARGCKRKKRKEGDSRDRNSTNSIEKNGRPVNGVQNQRDSGRRGRFFLVWRGPAKIFLRLSEGGFKGCATDGLVEKRGDLKMGCLNGQVAVPVPCDDDDLNLGVNLPDFPDHFQAVHSGHLHIGENNGGLFLPENLQT